MTFSVCRALMFLLSSAAEGLLAPGRQPQTVSGWRRTRISAVYHMKLSHPALAQLLQKAYSGEMAAAFAYVGHAGSLRCPTAKAAVKQIEDDEWHHRANVLALMQKYEVPVSRYYEAKSYCIGKIIAFSCYVIGR